jgi:hypothetical protein
VFIFSYNMSDEAEGPPVEETITEEELAKWMIYGIVIAVFAVLIPILSKIKRTRGKNPFYHLIFLGVAIASAFLVPDNIAKVLFSPAGVLIAGTLIPVYESIVAVCTIGEKDDEEWVQFWIVNASFTYATEFMDVFIQTAPMIAEHWYEFEFFCTLWFLLPFTDGSTLIYDLITAPYLAPLFKRIKKAMDGKMELILAAVNSGYMWIIFSTFMTLPEEARRFVVVAVGTVYPIVASTVSITTNSEEETFWLTYWSCFSLLFIAMDYLETFVGSIRGFYSLCLVATVYLFLPMFQGADVVFRRVLVPLSGQHENMLLRDTYLVRKEMERKIPAHLHEGIMAKAADVFLLHKNKAHHE